MHTLLRCTVEMITNNCTIPYGFETKMNMNMKTYVCILTFISKYVYDNLFEI